MHGDLGMGTTWYNTQRVLCHVAYVVTRRAALIHLSSRYKGKVALLRMQAGIQAPLRHELSGHSGHCSDEVRPAV